MSPHFRPVIPYRGFLSLPVRLTHTIRSSSSPSLPLVSLFLPFLPPLRELGKHPNHSLGRTARAGGTAKGVGILILAPFEAFFLRKPIVNSLPLTPHPPIAAAELEACRAQLARGMALVGTDEKCQYYAASLGFGKASLRDAFRGDAGAMVRVWNEFATAPVEQGGLGCAEVPGSASRRFCPPPLLSLLSSSPC